jgi:hypothetical protein
LRAVSAGPKEAHHLPPKASRHRFLQQKDGCGPATAHLSKSRPPRSRRPLPERPAPFEEIAFPGEGVGDEFREGADSGGAAQGRARVRLFHGSPDGPSALIPPRVLFEAARVESKLGQLSKQMGVAATVAEDWAMMNR